MLNKCQKCGKSGREIQYDKQVFFLCEECLKGLNNIIELWLEVKRGKQLNERTIKNLQEM